MYSSRLMGEDFSGRAPVKDLRFLRDFIVWALVNETYISFPGRTSFPHYVIPLYDSLWTSGSVIGGMSSESILLLLISSVETFSNPTRDVISLEGGWYFPSTSGLSILSLLTPAPLILVWRYFRRLVLSLFYSVVGSELIISSSWVSPVFAISRDLSSRYVSLSVIRFFL